MSMWAHEAIRLIRRLHHYWQVTPTDPPHVLSAVYAHIERVREEANEHQVMSTAELAEAGLVFQEV